MLSHPARGGSGQGLGCPLAAESHKQGLAEWLERLCRQASASAVCPCRGGWAACGKRGRHSAAQELWDSGALRTTAAALGLAAQMQPAQRQRRAGEAFGGFISSAIAEEVQRPECGAAGASGGALAAGEAAAAAAAYAARYTGARAAGCTGMHGVTLGTEASLQLRLRWSQWGEITAAVPTSELVAQL